LRRSRKNAKIDKTAKINRKTDSRGDFTASSPFVSASRALDVEKYRANRPWLGRFAQLETLRK
jgi:hypothetical protein